MYSDSDGSDGSWDWVYGDFQSGQLRDKIDQKLEEEKPAPVLEPVATTSTKLIAGGVNPNSIGVSREYEGGLRVLPPDNFSDSDEDRDDPKDRPLVFDPDLYQEFRELISELKESEFYVAYNAGKPTLAPEGLTWDRLFKEVQAIYGALDPGPGCPSTGPMGGLLKEYKQFRVEQIGRWQQNIRKHGNKIFMPGNYKTEDLVPKRPEKIRKLIETRFTAKELASFDMNPATNPSGLDHYLLPRPKLDPSYIRLLVGEGFMTVPELSESSLAIGDTPSDLYESEFDGSESGLGLANEDSDAQGNIKSDTCDETEEEPFFCRELTTLGLFDPKMCTVGFHLIPSLNGQMMAERIQECLLKFPLGVHFSKFVRVLEESLGYRPRVLELDFGTLSEMIRKEKDIFWTQSEPEFPPVGLEYLNQEILFPAHLAGMYANLLTILNRLWRKYRSMVSLLSPVFPLTEESWKKFQCFISESDTQDGFHYSDWGFETHEALVAFCLRKWKNPNFSILLPGTVMAGLPGTVSETSIYFGRGQILSQALKHRTERRTGTRSSRRVPVDCTLDASGLCRFADGLRPGDELLIGAGDFRNPHLFGVMELYHWEFFNERYKPKLRQFYKNLKTERRATYYSYKVDPDYLEPGQVVVVFYANEWDRAIVIKRLGGDNFLVYIFDWGSFTFTNYKKLRYMATKFMDFPALGILCKLAQGAEETEYHFAEERQWDRKAALNFTSFTLKRILEMKFLEVDTLCGQPIWTVEIRSCYVKPENEIEVPDVNRRTFIGSGPIESKHKPYLNWGGKRLLKIMKSHNEVHQNLQPGPLAVEDHSCDEDDTVDPSLLPNPSTRRQFHVLADPTRQVVEYKREAANLSDLDSCDETAATDVDSAEEFEKEQKEPLRVEILLAPRQKLDPLLTPMPVQAEAKLQAMKLSYRLPYESGDKSQLNPEISQQK